MKNHYIITLLDDDTEVLPYLAQKIREEFEKYKTTVQLTEYSSPMKLLTELEAGKQYFMRMDQYVDVLIPRGGAGLIRAVVEGSSIPVIETGTGNCHIYVDETANLSMAADIIENAKF